MATKTQSKLEQDLAQNGFDVTCTIGRVTFGNGDLPPHVAAFKLIAEHDAEGEYSFPMANGICHVKVDWELFSDADRTNY